MTENQQKEILNLSDTIKGEINRMCVTNDLSEMDDMFFHAKQNISRLNMLLYTTKFNSLKESDKHTQGD